MRRNTVPLIFAVLGVLSLNQLLMAQSRDADFDSNGIVEFGDFIVFAKAFGSNQSTFDLDGNGRVDFPDFVLFAKQYGDGKPESTSALLFRAARSWTCVGSSRACF